MNVTAISLLLIIICIFGNVQSQWDNNWDDPLQFTCSNEKQTIYYIRSQHHNRYEDRQYDLRCRDIDVPGGVHCHTSGYVNFWDRPVDYTCPHNGYINGMYSYHDNRREDRRHRYRCCYSSEYLLTNCYTTNYVNSWDETYTYRVPFGYVLRGIYSVHHNRHEDRRTKFRICRIQQL